MAPRSPRILSSGAPSGLSLASLTKAGSTEDRPRPGLHPCHLPRWLHPHLPPQAVPRAASQVRFSPSPGISNEAQFVFTIQSIVTAQKLKGTLSFIAKVPGGGGGAP